MVYDGGQCEKIESKVLVPPVSKSCDKEDLISTPSLNVNGRFWFWSWIVSIAMADFPVLFSRKIGTENNVKETGTLKIGPFFSWEIVKTSAEVFRKRRMGNGWRENREKMKQKEKRNITFSSEKELCGSWRTKREMLGSKRKKCWANNQWKQREILKGKALLKERCNHGRAVLALRGPEWDFFSGIQKKDVEYCVESFLGVRLYLYL
jgi:hypothetical protein